MGVRKPRRHRPRPPAHPRHCPARPGNPPAIALTAPFPQRPPHPTSPLRGFEAPRGNGLAPRTGSTISKTLWANSSTCLAYIRLAPRGLWPRLFILLAARSIERQHAMAQIAGANDRNAIMPASDRQHRLRRRIRRCRDCCLAPGSASPTRQMAPLGPIRH